ncbi:Ribosome bioproteinsis protein brx1 [Brettanomyces nanus]|uniref:Ribosome bioproteinsis protein brx1 n=1 Tax=Eeniella nana TaxID=13502 RepID=A0A875RYQ7_EENNA|nr:Ribosome biogenesis protein brx1 [Brettanomyces nanus]QPG73848.1 Ribosome bioproteinsis protein brx1 [Brettanomyces nanus]
MSAIYRALTQDTNSKGISKPQAGSFGPKRVNKQRVLLISSRGIVFRHRHLIADINALLPHSRKEPKLDTKKSLYELNELAEMYNCNNIMYFECRKHKDLYMWLSKPPNGPTIKFFVQNLHTMDELDFTGNCLKGSRPILSFDKTFETEEKYQLMKEMFIQQFGVPPRARRSKPFVDHVMTFSILDGKVWIRNYQINESKESQENEQSDEDLTLVEIGPRLVLTPIIILEGSFGGPKIFENKQYISPNVVRAQLKQQAAAHARGRQQDAQDKKLKKREEVLKADPLANDFLFKE